MEEIVSTDTIRAEIMDDAWKKAARMLEEADEESARTLVEMEAKADAVVMEILRTSESRSERFRMETLARLPLERTRLRTVFVDAQLREALASYFSALGEDRVAFLSEDMLARGASFFSGKALVLTRKGLSETTANGIAERILGSAALVDHAEDDSLPAPGLVARAKDGRAILWATLDIVEERLLDEKRGELAHALCAEALNAEANLP